MEAIFLQIVILSQNTTPPMNIKQRGFTYVKMTHQSREEFRQKNGGHKQKTTEKSEKKAMLKAEMSNQ